jgi:hypothetical protein
MRIRYFYARDRILTVFINCWLTVVVLYFLSSSSFSLCGGTTAVDAVFSEFPDRTRETIQVMNNVSASNNLTGIARCNLNCNAF